MKIQDQNQILSQEFRVMVIKEIQAKENIERKLVGKKQYDLLKDKNKKWVIESLRAENLSEQTIATMTNRASNISMFRLVVEKLSRTYKGGVKRTAANDIQNDQIAKLEDQLDINKQMKKCDRWLEAFKNAVALLVPIKNYRESTETQQKLDLSFRIFAPYQYDVLNYKENPERAAVFILSDYHEKNKPSLELTGAKRGGSARGVENHEIISKSSDFQDQLIADQDDKSSQEYIWWSDKYHFTTNNKGEVLQDKSPEDLQNPIQILPIVDLNEDQDGAYWAEGGEDLVDSCILVNKLITDLNSIAYQQGWGQPVITGGESLPEKYTIGTQNAIILQYDKEKDPQPTVEIIQGNPPINDWLSLIEQYVALTLSTNSLTPGNISMKLDPNSYQSGIAMIIEQAQANNDIQDKQEYFKSVEYKIWEVISNWQNLLISKNVASNALSQVGPVNFLNDMTIKFYAVQPPTTEKEKLETMKARRDLMLDRQLDLIKQDNPDLTDDQAKERLKEILEERLASFSVQESPEEEVNDDQGS